MERFSVVGHFWNWFEKHHSEYLLFFNRKVYSPKDRNYLHHELQMHLRAYSRQLFPELSVNKHKHGELVITASGKERYFKKADRLVAKAPPIPNWTFISLAPPGHLVGYPPLERYRAECDISEIWFQKYLYDEEGALHIIIYVKYILPGKLDSVWEYIDLFILNLIGERAATQDIMILDIQPLSLAEANKPLLDIKELPVILSRAASSIMITPGGEIDGL